MCFKHDSDTTRQKYVFINRLRVGPYAHFSLRDGTSHDHGMDTINKRRGTSMAQSTSNTKLHSHSTIYIYTLLTLGLLKATGFSCVLA